MSNCNDIKLLSNKSDNNNLTNLPYEIIKTEFLKKEYPSVYKIDKIHFISNENSNKLTNIDKLQENNSKVIEKNNQEQINFEKKPSINRKICVNYDTVSDQCSLNSSIKCNIPCTSNTKNIKKSCNENKKIEKAEDNNDEKFKLSETKIGDIVKRVIEENKKQAANIKNNIFNNITHNYMNLNLNKTQCGFFTAPSDFHRPETNARPSTEVKSNIFNYLEIKIRDSLSWKKHEEIWNNIHSPAFLISSDMEKYLTPPNDFDVLISSYSKLFNNYLDVIIIDDNLVNPEEEIIKWKKAYKRVILRWHPDKLNNIIDEIKLRDESKRSILKKKSSVIINNMNKLYANNIEILKKIILKKNLIK